MEINVIKWILEVCTQEGYKPKEFIKKYNITYLG